MTEGEKIRYIKEINKNIDTAKNLIKNDPNTSAVNAGKALEAAIKLYYGVKNYYSASKIFNLEASIECLKNRKCFDDMIISDMHLIRKARNTVHPDPKNKGFTEEYVDKLLVRLVDCVKAIEKDTGLEILKEPERGTYIHKDIPVKMTIKLGGEFSYHNNGELINHFFGTDYKCWNACTAKVNNDVYDNEIIWMIALTGKESDYGWTNSLEHVGEQIIEEYTGDLRTILPRHKYIDKTLHKIVFDIVEDVYRNREYIFRGVFEFDHEKGNHRRRVWKKISDEFVIDESLSVTQYENPIMSAEEPTGY